MKIILIIGLSGSGKTHYGRSLNLPFIDDYNQTHTNYDLTSFKDVLVIADPLLCSAEPTKAIDMLKNTFGDVRVELVLFKNQLDICLHNVQMRDDERLISDAFIIHLSKFYDLDKWLELNLPTKVLDCYGAH